MFVKLVSIKNSLVAICCIISLIPQGYAQTVGPSVPNNYSTFGTGAGWSNLSGVQLIDNSPAYVDLAQYPTCNNFICYKSNVASFNGFGFAIPTNAFVTGVELNVMQKTSSPGGGIHDSLLTLAINNISIGNDYASPINWFETPQTATYGSANDTWGNTLTPAQVNDPSFGIIYQITNSSYDQPASIDYLSMTIHYQTGTSFYSQNSNPTQIIFDGNSINIKISNAQKLNIYNANGQTVFSKFFSSNNVVNEVIYTSSLVNGIYFVTIEGQKGRIYQKKILVAN
jgi:hypothetical protein